MFVNVTDLSYSKALLGNENFPFLLFNRETTKVNTCDSMTEK